MALVDIPGVGVVDFPNTMTQQDIVRAIEGDILPFYQRQNRTQIAPQEQPQNTNALVSGAQTLRSQLGSAAEGVGAVSGLSGLREYGKRTREAGEVAAEAALPQERRMSFSEAQTPGDYLRALGQAAGTSFPQAAPGLAGALAGSAFGPVGALIGGAAGSGLGFYGANRQRQMEANPNQPVNELAAAGAAVPAALTEGLVDRFLFGMGRVLGVGTNTVRASIVPRIAVGIGAGAAAEIPAEVMQQALERAQAGLDVLSPDAMAEYREAALAAGALGGLIGGATGAVRGQRPAAPPPRGEDVELRQALEELRAEYGPEAAITPEQIADKVEENLQDKAEGVPQPAAAVGDIPQSVEPEHVVMPSVAPEGVESATEAKQTAPATQAAQSTEGLPTYPQAPLAAGIPQVVVPTFEQARIMADRDVEFLVEAMTAASGIEAPVWNNLTSEQKIKTVELINARKSEVGLDERGFPAQPSARTTDPEEARRRLAPEPIAATVEPIAEPATAQEGEPAVVTEAATEPTTEAAQVIPEEQKVQKEARRLVANRLDALRSQGKQGQHIASGLETAIAKKAFAPQQLYEAFRAGDIMAGLLPQGANHQVNFIDSLGNNIQGERVTPANEGMNGIINLSLAEDQLPMLRETAAHEAFHVLQDYYAKYDPEFSKLMAKDFKQGMTVDELPDSIKKALSSHNIPGADQTYFDFLRATPYGKDMPVSEIQAYVFGSLLDMSKRGIPITAAQPAYRRFINFLKKFFNRMGDEVGGSESLSALQQVARGEGKRFETEVSPAGQSEVQQASRSSGAVAGLPPFGQRLPASASTVTAAQDFTVVYSRTSKFLDRMLGKRFGEKAGEDLIVKFQDKMMPVGRMTDDIIAKGGKVSEAAETYMKEELYHDKVGTLINEREKNLYKPIFDAIKKSGLEIKDVENFLYARHARERNEYIRSINQDPTKGSGMTDKEANDMLLALTPKMGKIKPIAALVDKVVADTNAVRLKSGLSPDFTKLKGGPNYQHYVPLRGYADDNMFVDEGVAAISANVERGFKVRGKEDKTAIGRSSTAGHIIANVILQNEESVIRSEKNNVGKSFLRMLEENPVLSKGFAEVLVRAPVKPRIVNGVVKLVPDPLYKNRPDILVVKEGGREVAIQIKDPRVAKSMIGATGLGSENIGWLVRMMGRFNRYLVAVNTAMNPEFLIANFLRDIQAAGVNIQQYEKSGLAGKIIKDVPSAMSGIRAAVRNDSTGSEWSKAYQEFRQAGGGTSHIGFRDLEAQINKVNEGLLTDPKRSKQAIQWVGKFIEDYNHIVENGVRLSTFKRLRDMGVSAERSAQVAKNLTVNFNKAGENKAVMNAMYLFYNASIQGSMVIANALARSKRVRKVVAGLVVAGLVQDMINQMASGDDNDGGKTYDKIPGYVLEHNFVLMDLVGLTERGYFAFPMPYGFNAFYNLGRVIGRFGRGGYTAGEALSSGLVATVEAFNPIGGSETLLNFIAPTIVDPIVSLYTNTDFTGRPIVPGGGGPRDLTPESQRYWGNTNPAAVAVADWVNSSSGGTPMIPGAVDISPNTIGFLANYATGALGQFIARSYQTAAHTIPDALRGDLEEFDVRSVPFLRKVYGNVTSRNDMEKYIEVTQEVQRVSREVRDAQSMGNTDRVEEAFRRFPNQLAVAPAIEHLVRQNSTLSQQIRRIERMEIPDDERKQILKELKDAKNLIVGQVNSLYREYVTGN